MPCDERSVSWRVSTRAMSVMSALGVLVALGLSACSTWPGLGGTSGSATGPDGARQPTPVTPAARGEASPAASKDRASASERLGPVKLPPPAVPRSWAQARQQAAQRMVAANPHLVYDGRTPDILLAIPVMSIDLNADGSIRRIEVMRYPGQARDTVQLAIQAIRNAAPFGDVSKLPKPWRFNETFLFNDARKFKPMTLDRR